MSLHYIDLAYCLHYFKGVPIKFGKTFFSSLGPTGSPTPLPVGFFFIFPYFLDSLAKTLGQDFLKSIKNIEGKGLSKKLTVTIFLYASL